MKVSPDFWETSAEDLRIQEVPEREMMRQCHQDRVVIVLTVDQVDLVMEGQMATIMSLHRRLQWKTLICLHHHLWRILICHQPRILNLNTVHHLRQMEDTQMEVLPLVELLVDQAANHHPDHLLAVPAVPAEAMDSYQVSEEAAEAAA